MMQLIGCPCGDPFLVVDCLADLKDPIKIGWQLETGLLDQIAPRRAEDHRPGFDTIGIGVALGIPH